MQLQCNVSLTVCENVFVVTFLTVWLFISGHSAGSFTANTIAHTAAERFALLEERDKFLRSSMLFKSFAHCRSTPATEQTYLSVFFDVLNCQ